VIEKLRGVSACRILDIITNLLNGWLGGGGILFFLHLL